MNRLKYIDSSERSKRFKRNLIHDILTPNGLKFREVSIDTDTNNEDIQEFNCEISYIEKQDLQYNEWIRRVIFIKDKNNISDRTYKSLQKDLNLKLPTLHKIRKEIRRYDNNIELMVNEKGVFVDIEIVVNPQERTLYIKFSADGAQIIKHKLILNVTFTILNEGSI